MTGRLDARGPPSYVVRVDGREGDVQALVTALLDVPETPDDDVARLEISSTAAFDQADAHVILSPTDASAAQATGKPVFFARRELPPSPDSPVDIEPRTFSVGNGFETVGALRAAVLEVALVELGIPVERARRAKRPYATAIIAAATLLSAGEGVLPGTAAWVVGTQVSAVAGLHYLYTGKLMARSQVFSFLPVYASEAAGGSLFLLAKSVLPPTGVGEVAASVVAAGLSLTMLGSVAWLFEQGYAIDEKEKLRLAFRRMSAKTKAERAELARNRHRLRDERYLRDLVRRIVFD